MTTVRSRSPRLALRVHRELLAPSFPAHELLPRRSFVLGVLLGRLELTCLVNGDDLLAVAVGEPDRENSVMLLAWLAAAPASRGTGAGGAVLQDFLDDCRERRIRLVLGEVEHPSGPASQAHGDPRSRVRFYARTGARVMDIPYFQPPITRGQPRVPLMLVVYSEDGRAPGETLSTTRLRPWLSNLMKGQTMDEQLESLLASVQSDTVRTLALDAADDELPGWH